MTTNKTQSPTYREIVATRKLLKPGDAGYAGDYQYAGKHPTPNPRIARNIIRKTYTLINKIQFGAYSHDHKYADNAIIAKGGEVAKNAIPGLLHYVDYVIIRQPNTRKMYALPYRVHQLLQNDKSDIQIELYINEANDTKAIITVGYAEATIDSMEDSPSWIGINNCDPFNTIDGLTNLQLTKPLMQYIAKTKQRYIAATSVWGSELATDGYTILHTNKWHFCLPADKFNYIKGEALKTTSPVTLQEIQELMPRYEVACRNELLLELVYPNNQIPLLVKNRTDYIAWIGQHGIDLKSPERGDIHMPALETIIPPRMKAPYIELPEDFIEALGIITSKSKKHVQDIKLRIFQHHDNERSYYMQAEAKIDETVYQLSTVVKVKATKEEEEARIAAASQAQADKEARWKAQDEAEEAARHLGQEERERVIREAQERIKAEEAAALAERIKAEEEEIARIKAEEAKTQSPADNYKQAMAIIANPKSIGINYLPTYTIPKPQPNAEQWEIDAYIAQRYLRTMAHFMASMIFYRDDMEGFAWRTTYTLSNEHRDIFRKHFPNRPTTTNHESYIKHLNAADKALRDTTIYATGGGVITYRNGKQYVFSFNEVEPASPELLAALSRPVQYNPGLVGIVEMDETHMPEAIESSDTAITHPIYPEAKIEDASHVTKVITSHNGSIIAVIEEHDINDITPTFTAPSILDEFDTSPIVPAVLALPIKPTTLPELPAVIEAHDTPKPARIDYLQDGAALSSLFATLSGIVGINVMLVGTWIWVDGDTKPVKEQLKALGMKWHSQKKKWYLSLSGEYFKTRRKTYFIDIAMKYGVRTLKTND